MQLMKESFKETLNMFKSDKIILLLSLAPILIGIFLYGLIGGWLFNTIMIDGKEWVVNKISQGMMGSVVYYFMVTMVTLLLLLLINYTFVLVVSLVACPLNDFISSRVYKNITNGEVETLSNSIGGIGNRITKTLINEFKKIFIILVLSLLGFLIGFIPLLIPISFLISAILLSVAFIDYNWSRDNLNFFHCLKNYRAVFLGYTLSGIIFLFILSIPVFNLFCYPLAVVYYSILYTKDQLAQNLKTGEQ